jgi:two-component system, OmpR family, sensor histidine kinase TctE
VPMAIKADIDLGFESDDVPLVIEADVDRLRELINNLLDNAIRYSRPQGRATVAVRAAGNQVQLSVSDDGPHIPEAEKTRIFERFHRVLGTPTTGSGLGLAIVSEIATLHGARIVLEADADGVGNRFCVLFPRAESTGLSAG